MLSSERNLELSLEWGCDAEVWHIISPEQMAKLVESGDKDDLNDNEVCGEVDIDNWINEYLHSLGKAEQDLELLLFMAVTDCPDHIMKQYM